MTHTLLQRITCLNFAYEFYRMTIHWMLWPFFLKVMEVRKRRVPLRNSTLGKVPAIHNFAPDDVRRNQWYCSMVCRNVGIGVPKFDFAPTFLQRLRLAYLDDWVRLRNGCSNVPLRSNCTYRSDWRVFSNNLREEFTCVNYFSQSFEV